MKSFDPVLPMIVLGLLGVLAAVLYALAVTVADDEWYVRHWSSRDFESGHGPAIVFGMPFVWPVTTFDDGIQRLHSKPGRYLLAGRSLVSADCSVDWRIKDIGRFFSTVGETGRAERFMGAVVQKGLKDWIGSHHAIDPAELETDLQRELLPMLEERGIEVISVRVREIGGPSAWRGGLPWGRPGRGQPVFMG